MDGSTTQTFELFHLPGFYEPVSVASHLIGATAFSILGYRLVRCSGGDRARAAFLGVYAASCVFLMAMSGIYHMMSAGGAARMVMARLDHSAIFVLIAGTFTPVHGILFRGWGRWGPLLLIWGACSTGIVLKLLFFDAWPEGLGISLYLLLGWLGAISGTAIALRYGFTFVKPLLWGGIAYSVGALIEFVRWPVLVPGVVHSHELFHLAVLIGAFYQWSFVRRIASWPIDVEEGCAAELPDARLPLGIGR